MKSNMKIILCVMKKSAIFYSLSSKEKPLVWSLKSEKERILT